MVNQKEKKQMLDFFVSKLEYGNHKVLPQSMDLHGNKTDYILTEEGLILLANNNFGKDNFNNVLKSIKDEFKGNFGIVFYKDGETFFRSAVAGKNETGIKSKRSKIDNGTLKNYNNDDLNKMISLTPEEIIINNERKLIQYYQPTSERLEEKLVTLNYTPVTFDYSHINNYERFQPENKSSKRLHIWNDRQETSNILKLDYNVLKEINNFA